MERSNSGTRTLARRKVEWYDDSFFSIPIERNLSMMSLVERHRPPPAPVSVIVVVMMVDKPLEKLSLVIAIKASKSECSALCIDH